MGRCRIRVHLVIATIVLAPTEVLSIAAGFVFGVWAFPLVVVSATVGATLAFLMARHLFRDRILILVGDPALARAIDSAVGVEGWKLIALLRLNPLVPFGLQNYLFGTINAPLSTYVITTLLGIMPGTAMYVCLGMFGRELTRAQRGAPEFFLLGVGLLATTALVLVIARKAKTALGETRVASDVSKPESGRNVLELWCPQLGLH
jgi:uncharacterized membrane protein YdjX (TVP38/TMEM64 family)